jgi:hypothetical protein
MKHNSAIFKISDVIATLSPVVDVYKLELERDFKHYCTFNSTRVKTERKYLFFKTQKVEHVDEYQLRKEYYRTTYLDDNWNTVYSPESKLKRKFISTYKIYIDEVVKLLELCNNIKSQTDEIILHDDTLDVYNSVLNSYYYKCLRNIT